MRRLVLGLAVLALAGCSVGGDDSGGGSVEASELSATVLQPEDLPQQFVQFDEGRQTISDRPAGARGDPTRFGRIEGWKARYQRRGGPTTEGPIVVESRADLFDSAAGAGDELDTIENLGFDPLDAPDLGEEARAWETVQGGGVSEVRYYAFAWRENNLTGSVLASGFEGRFTYEDALALARKQQARMARATA
jgi:hypothetical protein